jgi:hypothetical protein
MFSICGQRCETKFPPVVLRGGTARAALLLGNLMRAIEKASLWLLLAASAWLVGCASLPERPSESVPVHSENTDGTRLGRVVAPFVAEHPGLSGVFPIEVGVDAWPNLALQARARRKFRKALPSMAAFPLSH